jgi:hypothetical protein
MFPLLTGFSVFCLANPRSPNFTRVFGGSNGNEGLGFLSICFDWQYISGSVNPFVIPLRAQVYPPLASSLTPVLTHLIPRSPTLSGIYCACEISVIYIISPT